MLYIILLPHANCFFHSHTLQETEFITKQDAKTSILVHNGMQLVDGSHQLAAKLWFIDESQETSGHSLTQRSTAPSFMNSAHKPMSRVSTSSTLAILGRQVRNGARFRMVTSFLNCWPMFFYKKQSADLNCRTAELFSTNELSNNEAIFPL